MNVLLACVQWLRKGLEAAERALLKNTGIVTTSAEKVELPQSLGPTPFQSLEQLTTTWDINIPRLVKNNGKESKCIKMGNLPLCLTASIIKDVAINVLVQVAICDNRTWLAELAFTCSGNYMNGNAPIYDDTKIFTADDNALTIRFPINRNYDILVSTFNVCIFRFVREGALADFSQEAPEASGGQSVRLRVGGRLFNVSRALLMLHSTFFQGMFNGKFKEADEQELDLPEIDGQTFEYILRMIYPERLKIFDHKIVEGIVHLADYLDIDLVITECDRFLVVTNELSLVDKLRLAHRYNLRRLQFQLLKTIDLVALQTRVLTNAAFDELPGILQLFLLRRAYVPKRES